jgi:transcriptional regulator with XRE-family HTH domain
MSSEKILTGVQRSLIRMRERFNVTQQQLAEALGVRVQTVSKWECTRSPSGESLHMLVSFARSIGDWETAKIFHDAAFSGALDLLGAEHHNAAEHSIWYLRSGRSDPAVHREYCKVLRALIAGLDVAIGKEQEALGAQMTKGGKWRPRRIVVRAGSKGPRFSRALPLSYLVQAQKDLQEELKNEEQETKKR